MNQTSWIPLGWMFLALGCSSQAKQIPLAEDLSRLRTLGVATSPVVPEVVATGATAKTAILTVYAAVPSGQDVSLTGLEAKGAVNIAPASMTIAAPIYEEHTGFRLVKFAVTVPIPTQSAFHTSNSGGTAANGSGTSATAANSSQTSAAATLAAISSQVGYSFALTSGSRTETADGSFLVAGTGNTELTTTAPALTITAPSAGAQISSGASDLTLDYTLANQEGTTVAWFVDSGEVKNRRNAVTTWVPGKGASHSAIGTVRTNRTFGFALQIIDVTTE